MKELNLDENHAVLLRKIEELTFYIKEAGRKNEIDATKTESVKEKK